MSAQTVLITGANGHIGFRVVVFALQAGYNVRAAVRTQDKADRISSAPSIKEIKPGDRLTFSFVPDLLAPGAYDAAIKNVDYAIHVASPITSGATPEQFNDEAHFMNPAINGTVAILKAAQTAPTVKRVVITSSVVAQIPWYDVFEAETDTVFNEQSRTEDPAGPFKSEFEAYSASKVRAFNATLNFLDHNTTTYDVVHVHPSFVIGRDELVTDAADFTRGTNRIALSAVLGIQQGYGTPSVSVHLDDVATAHVKALAPNVPSGYSLVTSSEGIKGTQWGDAVDIVNRRFPQAVAAGVLPNNGSTPTKLVKVDASETERLLGYTFKSFEDQIVSVVSHYLELKGVAAA